MTPCLQCRNSKKRCDRLTPCTRCVQYQLPCAYTLTNPFQRPSTKLQRLHLTLDKIESEVKGSWYQFKLWEGIWKEFQGGNERKWSWTRVKLDEDGDGDGLVRHPHPVVLYRWKRRGRSSFFHGSDVDSNESNMSSEGSSSPSIYKEINLSSLLARHMLDLYIERLHPIYPFINPQKLEAEFKDQPLTSPLLTSIYLKAYYVTLGEQGCVNIPPLEYCPFYQRACHLLQLVNLEDRDLSWVQACLILVGMELAHLVTPQVHQRIMHAVKQAQMLFINDPQSLSRVNETWETRLEGDNTWRMCIILDTLISVHLDTPPIIREYFGGEPPMPEQLPSPQDPMLHSVHLMEHHKHWCQLVTQMRRVKCVFDPKTATHSQTFALNLMLNQVQDRFPRLWNPTRLSLKLDQPFLTGYLVLYLIHLVLVVDLTEMLLVCPEQPNSPEPRGESYLDIQHQAAILLIEAMFPHPITQASRSLPPQLQQVEMLDYIFTMAVFHACKVLVHESEPGAVEYFYKVKDTCLSTLELFPCNYQIKLFFDYYWEHPSKVQKKIGKGTIGLVSGFEI